MTGETLTAPAREPFEARLLGAIGAGLALAFWVILIWQQLEPDGPREWLARQRDRLEARREYRRAMEDTLADIDRLPEVELELDEGDAWNAT